MSLLFDMPSRLLIAFLPRNKCLLISWLLSPSAVILELKKIKSVICSGTFFLLLVCGFFFKIMNSVKGFYDINWDDHVGFYLSFCCPSITGVNCIWSWYMILLIWYLICFANILCRVFSSYSYEIFLCRLFFLFLFFLAAATICSGFEVQKNKVSHCFLCFPIY